MGGWETGPGPGRPRLRAERFPRRLAAAVWTWSWRRAASLRARRIPAPPAHAGPTGSAALPGPQLQAPLHKDPLLQDTRAAAAVESGGCGEGEGRAGGGPGVRRAGPPVNLLGAHAGGTDLLEALSRQTRVDSGGDGWAGAHGELAAGPVSGPAAGKVARLGGEVAGLGQRTGPGSLAKRLGDDWDGYARGSGGAGGRAAWPIYGPAAADTGPGPASESGETGGAQSGATRALVLGPAGCWESAPRRGGGGDRGGGASWSGSVRAPRTLNPLPRAPGRPGAEAATTKGVLGAWPTPLAPRSDGGAPGLEGLDG
jgi:hypothetical protein